MGDASDSDWLGSGGGGWPEGEPPALVERPEERMREKDRPLRGDGESLLERRSEEESFCIRKIW